MAIKPILRLVYEETTLEGTLPSILEKKVTGKNPKIRQGHIYQALDELRELGAIKLISL